MRIGEPIAGTRASLHPWEVAGVGSPWPASELMLDDGGVQVRDLPAGKWILFLDAGEARMGYTEIEVGPRDSLTSEVELGEAGRLECHVPDVQGGWMYVHARLMLPIRPPGWFDLGDGRLRRYARTDNPAEVTSFGNLFPGTWQVSAANAREFAELSGVVLRPGEARAAQLEAEPSAVLHLEYSAPETSVRIVLELSTDRRPEWTRRHDMLIQPNETPHMPLPIPTGRVRWRARYLHPLVRITEAEIYLRQEGEVVADQGSQVRAFLSFARMP